MTLFIPLNIFQSFYAKALVFSALTRRIRGHTSTDDVRISTAPDKWPGVNNLVALLSREKGDETPHLRQVLAECFIAITMSLFCFALAVYDSRWLYRLVAHEMDAMQFSLIFGGGGEKKVPPLLVQGNRRMFLMRRLCALNCMLRFRLWSLDRDYRILVFGADVPQSGPHSGQTSPAVEQTVTKWIPPQKNIVQFFADKPAINSKDELGVDFDSDDESGKSTTSDLEEDRCENANPASFAWQLIRLALVEQQIYKIRHFLVLAGFDANEIPGVAPRVQTVLRLLDEWEIQLRQCLKSYRGGCPVDLLPNMTIDIADANSPLMNLPNSHRKYAVIAEKHNTPFESEDLRAGPLRRLWAYLTRQENLQPLFVRHIFASRGQQEQPIEKNDTLATIENHPLPDAFKIIQKDSEPIVAFACDQERPGWLVVSTGRELQEMDISGIFEECNNASSWLYNRTELDQLTPWIIDRSRKGLHKMFKRTISGIRRIDSHPNAPLYVTGSSDGSIRVWEWGVGQPVYTARVAGQYAKVSKISFSCNGNKFAAVDGDGMMCLWEACRSAELKKPSSVLITAGASSGEFNLALWDTLLPQNRALVHSWVAHNEGASVAMYLPSQQAIVSGGRHGDLCLWDIRQRQLRATVKAFESHQIVKTLVTDYTQDLIVAGSSDGDIKIWSADMNPQLMYSLPGEHAAKVAQSTVQGVQQLYIDQQLRLFSCGADASLKFRMLPSVYNITHLI
ncbi:unnamed protein product [Angiostrongylus costaricensis]|uniref:Uncharacterized protein n=1 Tax=Angiostrongylus costaricensis TaxID=334426 RepID=A0A3P7HNW8_ANGCS|nr:unnamed protein product [Angiostrongylus costaricensis]